jgi:hypothetical protein
MQQIEGNDITEKTRKKSLGKIVVCNKGKRGYTKENKEQGSGSWVISCDSPFDNL